MKNKKISIVGTVGLPANYGGFETLVDNLVNYHSSKSLPYDLTIYCSSKTYPEKKETHLSAKLKYIPLQANGIQSTLYDILSVFSSVWNRDEVILILGVSGAIVLPLVRVISSAHIITNIDGIEWKRHKWQGIAKWFLRTSEKIAINFSHEVIADNQAIANYVLQNYKVESHVIAYGGDHAQKINEVSVDEHNLPRNYAFSVCRIEPENNVHLIVQAFSKQDLISLVIVGNWNNSAYGTNIKNQYSTYKHIYLLDPVYDLGKLKTLRSQATLYIHGHSAGGTNPSLVEAMHFGHPIFAYDCNFNRCTTEDKALYFSTENELLELILSYKSISTKKTNKDILEIANRRYTWGIIAKQYFSLFDQ